MKKLVIIGGGFAGSTVARELEKEFDTLLIDTKDFFEFTPGILRTIVEPEHMNKIYVMYKDYLKRTKLVMGEVKEANEKIVVCKGKKIKYNYLVICSGSNYKAPIKEQHIVHTSRAKHLVESYENLKNAKDCLIIGGGISGVELAAEISSKYPNKKLTLVHSHEKLIQRNNKKAQDYVENFLKKREVNLVLGERVINGDKKIVKTDKGTMIKSDIVFLCTGIKPNSNFINGELKKSLDERGFLKVNENMQVDSFKNIFAPGDVNSWKIEKTAQNAEHQAKVVVKNIRNIESGNKLEGYFEKKTPMIISLGKLNGIFEYKKIVITGLIPGLMKSFVEWKEMLKLKI